MRNFPLRDISEIVSSVVLGSVGRNCLMKTFLFVSNERLSAKVISEI
jgi:hypothetical protein